jgi:hypothetical protein
MSWRSRDRDDDGVDEENESWVIQVVVNVDEEKYMKELLSLMPWI